MAPAVARMLPWGGLVLGLVAVGLQFGLSLPSLLAAGRDLPGALGHFFSYYTILTNIILVLIYLSSISRIAWLAPFRTPLVRGTMAANITLVSLFVYFVLRHLYVLEGAWKVADDLLHYVAPLVYVVWWVLGPHGALHWRQLPLMLAPTLVYFFCILARGAWVQEYPYPVIDVTTHGYSQVLLNALGMTAFLASLCILVLIADFLLARPSRTKLA